MKKIISFIVLVSFLSLNCSTLVNFTTEPAGAKVYVDDQYVGETPTKTRMSNLAWKEHELKITKAGYKTIHKTAHKEFKAGAFVGGLFLWPFFFWVYGPKKFQSFTLQKGGSGKASIHNNLSNYFVYVNGELLKKGENSFKPGTYSVSYESQNKKDFKTAQVELKIDHSYYLENR